MPDWLDFGPNWFQVPGHEGGAVLQRVQGRVLPGPQEVQRDQGDLLLLAGRGVGEGVREVPRCGDEVR